METKEIMTLFAIISFIIVGVAVLLPLGITLVNTAPIAGVTSGEQVTGVASTALGVAHSPVLEVTAFAKSLRVTTYNLTNSTSNATVHLVTDTPITAGTTFNITVKSDYNVTVDENISVTINSCLLGNMSDASETWTGVASTCLTGGAEHVVFFKSVAGSPATTINNVSITYYNLATPSTAYTLVQGEIKPTTSGTYLVSYKWGEDNALMIVLVLSFVPVLLATLMIAGLVYYLKGFGTY